MEAQLEALRATVAELTMSGAGLGGGRAASLPGAAGSSTDLPRRDITCPSRLRCSGTWSHNPDARWRGLRPLSGHSSCKGASPTEITALRFHRCLTVKFASFPEAVACTKALQVRCFDRVVAFAVEANYKGAKQQRPASASQSRRCCARANPPGGC